MDELTAFAGAPPELREREEKLLARADLVFAGGRSLYEGKRDRHPRVYFLASSVDIAALRPGAAGTGRTRRPEGHSAPAPRAFSACWTSAWTGRCWPPSPTCGPTGNGSWSARVSGKIPEGALPQRPNIHYLGGKDYADLPAYLAGWDVAMMPFARNEATRFISPTKTPEYLAAGKPVVSTSILDVVRQYGDAGLVRIADTPEEFVAACEAALQEDAPARLARVDPFLAEMSWDKIWDKMHDLIGEVVRGGRRKPLSGRQWKRERKLASV